MDTSPHPQGRLPQSVYWRRRIVVLVALIAVVALAWMGVGALTGGGDDAAAASESETQAQAGAVDGDADDATETGDQDADAAAAEEASATIAEPAAAASPSPEPSETASAPIEPCAADAISVTLSESPTVTENAVTFHASVTQSGADPCLVVADDEATALTVSSGGVRVWGSRDCDDTAAVIGKRWVIEPGASENFEMQWPRKWSFEGCTTLPDIPQPGTYSADLTVGEVVVPSLRFTI